MIFTKINYLISEDLPINLSDALNFLIYNRNSLQSITKQIYASEYFQIEYINFINYSENSYWQSHRKYIYIYIVLNGEEIIDISDINDLSIYQDYQRNSDTILYVGNSQNRFRLQRDDIIIIYPEEAYRIHYIPKHSTNKLLLKVPIA